MRVLPNSFDLLTYTVLCLVFGFFSGEVHRIFFTRLLLTVSFGIVFNAAFAGFVNSIRAKVNK